MKVLLHNGSLWDFKPDTTNPSHLLHKTKKSVYRLFIDFDYNGDIDIWIGKFMIEVSTDRAYWVTCEAEIRADKIFFLRGEFVFKRRQYSGGNRGQAVKGRKKNLAGKEAR